MSKQIVVYSYNGIALHVTTDRCSWDLYVGLYWGEEVIQTGAHNV